MNWKYITPKPGCPRNLGINAGIFVWKKPVHDTIDLKQRLIDIWAVFFSINENENKNEDKTITKQKQ